MKRLFVVSLIALTALFGGCLTSSNTKDSNSGGGGNGGTWKVSGYVKLTKIDGAGISGVQMKLEKNNGNSSDVFTLSTNSSGYYEFTELVNGVYTVTPTKSGYTFAPATVSCTVADKDVIVQTFIGTTSSGGGGGGGTGSGGTNYYLPLKVGATWTYTQTYTDPDGKATESASVSKIVGTSVQNGKTYWMMEEKKIEEYSYADTTLIRIDGNKIYSFFAGNMMVKPAGKAALAAKMAAAAKALVETYGNEVAVYQFGLSSGTTWTIYESTAQGTTVKMTGKSLGAESNSVPAGSFSGCAKLELTVNISYTYDKETYISNTVDTSWFAPNVGPIKNSSVTSSSSTTYPTPMITKSEDVLKSYSIP